MPGFLNLSRAQQAPAPEVFWGGERHLLDAFARHFTCAWSLLSLDEALIGETEFHAVMAAECLLKYIFCMIRFARGVKANSPEEFCDLKKAKDHGHEVKRICALLLTHDPELAVYDPLVELVTLLPSGTEWNEARYGQTKPPTATWLNKVRRMLALVGLIDAEVIGRFYAA